MSRIRRDRAEALLGVNRKMVTTSVKRLIESADLPTKNPTRLIGQLRKQAKRDGLSKREIAHLGSVLRSENAKKLRGAKRKPVVEVSQSQDTTAT